MLLLKRKANLLVFITVLLLVVSLFAYILFFSKSQSLGKILYALNNRVEASIAGLTKHNIAIGEEQYIFLSNNKVDRPLLLLLHGFSADKNIWLKFAKHANKDFHVVIPDLLGHGEIPYDPNKTYSTEEQIQYVSNLIVYLSSIHEVSISITGNSMGGMIAAKLLQKWDNIPLANIELKKMVLLDPAGAYSDFAKEMQTQLHNPFLHHCEESVFSFYDKAMHKKPFMPPSVFCYIAKAQYLDKFEQHKHMFSDFFNVEHFFKEKIDFNSEAPLVIWGDKDGLLPVADAAVWEGLLSIKAIRLPNIGHMPMVECPKHTYELLKSSFH